VARLQTGHLALHLAPVDLADLAQRVVEQFTDQLGPDYPLRLQASDDPCLVQADAGRLEQIVVNLVGNAAKYSPSGGGVEMSVWPADDGVLLEVQDHGIGLPPDVVESIFRPFGRAPNALARQIPGMGLGLFICREIAQRHGGRIWATSPGEDQGTTLHLWLPCQPPDR
jgi:signal transduction histidine kinase